MTRFPSPTEVHEAKARESRAAVKSAPSAAPARIGVGIDGTSSGRDAAALGAFLARATAADLMLIAIREDPILAVAVPPGMNRATLRKQAWAALKETRDALAPDARIVAGRDALVWKGLKHVVRQEHRDVLIVGSARTASGGRVRLGSSAGELLGRLDCPLAIAPAGVRGRGKKALKRIGVGLDGSDESRAALRLAASIAAASGAELDVRTAVDGPTRAGRRPNKTELDAGAIVENELASLLERDPTAAPATAPPARVEVVVGMPADILSELGAQVELLVLGSTRRGPAGKVEAGGTGRALLDGGVCPLLLAPKPD